MLAPERLHEYAVRASEATGWDECEDIIRDAVDEAVQGPVVAVRVEFECVRTGSARRHMWEFSCRDDSDRSGAELFVRKLGHGRRACCRVLRITHQISVEKDVSP